MAGLLQCLIGTGEFDDAEAMINALQKKCEILMLSIKPRSIGHR